MKVAVSTDRGTKKIRLFFMVATYTAGPSALGQGELQAERGKNSGGEPVELPGKSGPGGEQRADAAGEPADEGEDDHRLYHEDPSEEKHLQGEMRRARGD